MGRIKWRMHEWLYLEELAASTVGHDLLGQNDRNWWKNAVHWFVTKYKERFNHRFEAETTEDFVLRSQLQPRAKQEPFPAEKEEDRRARLANISTRIGNYVKSKSINRTRNNLTKSRRSKSPSVSVVDVMAKSTSTPQTPATSGFQLFLTSHHPARPLTAGLRDGRGDVAGYSAVCSEVYKALPDRDVFESQAKTLNAARHSNQNTATQDRNAKLAQFLPFFKKTYETMADEVGWVGWFPVGGIDEHGKIVAIHDGTAAREHETYEEYLAKRIGWSVDRLRLVFDDFLRDMFDPPLYASEPAVDVSAISQPSSSDPGLSGDAPSVEQPLIGTSSSSVAPTPQSPPTGPARLPLDIHSPTAHSPVSLASNPCTAPEVSLSNGAVGDRASPPDPSWRGSPTRSEASPEMPTAPSTSSNSRPRDTATPVETPLKQLPIPTTPTTPSDSRSLSAATPVETPSKRSPVQFGSAPDRVLTTAPRKRKASARRGGTKSRQPARTKSRAVRSAAEPPIEASPAGPASRKGGRASATPAANAVTPVDSPVASPRGRGKRIRVQTAKAIYQQTVNEARPTNSRRLETSWSNGVDTNADEGNGGNGGSVGRHKRKRR